VTREEHLQWAKNRALEYADKGESQNALASMASDLSKHPDTKTHTGIELGMMLLMSGNMRGPTEIRKFIEGFN
jgi:hypothetical protein